MVDRYTTNGGYHRQQLWKKVFEDELAPSRRKLVELTLDEPIRVERGRRVGIYIHSAERGDQGIVYDNVAELRPRAKRDRKGDYTSRRGAFEFQAVWSIRAVGWDFLEKRSTVCRQTRVRREVDVVVGS